MSKGEKPQMKLYVVTADGWRLGYGSELYLIGVFDNEDRAIEALDKAREVGAYCEIKQVTLNEEHPMKKGEGLWKNSLSNDIYLGGYCE